jgi:hypothetical protein
MKGRDTLKHKFVDSFPDEIEDGVLYISIPFATAAHRCFCGCGNEVITPFSPTDWKLTFDGRTVSLDPSVGNWSFRCQSHYIIRNNSVLWAQQWTREQIEAGRAHDRVVKDAYYGKAGVTEESRPARKSALARCAEAAQGAWRRLTKFWP